MTSTRRLYTLFFSLLVYGFHTLCSPCAFAGQKIFGITIDDPWTNQAAIHDALASHTIKPFTRIVFDEYVPAADYLAAVDNIYAVSHVMGEILDSYYVAGYTVQQYLDRTNEYLSTLKDRVDIWEIGNEINGDWLGNTADVVAKIEGAYALAKSQGVTTAINFYYNKACFYDKPEHEMFTWIRQNISDELKNGLDYVFFSYYEDDCEGVVYSEDEWKAVFGELHTIFPLAKLGFGEVGTTDSTKKGEYMQRYYSINIQEQYYIGGYFWWYYKQDCVPKTTDLWSLLDTTVTLAYKNESHPLVPIVNFLLLSSP